MAQKKLLFFLVFVGLFNCLAINAKAEGYMNGGVVFEDRKWITNLVQNTSSSVFEGIRKKYTELQKMLGIWDDNTDEETIDRMFKSGEVLRVFVSSSMSSSLLKKYVNEAKKYQAILVFNGLPNGSWVEMSGLVSEIIDIDDEVAIQIDDEAFKRYGIKSVPSFVLSFDDRLEWQKESGLDEVFDKASGNIGIRRFLRLVANGGEMAKEARELLE